MILALGVVLAASVAAAALRRRRRCFVLELELPADVRRLVDDDDEDDDGDDGDCCCRIGEYWMRTETTSMNGV